MTRKDHIAEVDPAEWDLYFSKAEEHKASAETLAADENYNSACLLLVHAVINYSDAVTIFVTGQKSTSEAHDSAARLLTDKFTDKKDREAIKHFTRVLGEKGRVEYTGESFKDREWTAMIKHLERFRSWAISKLPVKAG